MYNLDILGTIHILRKHLYSTKLNLTSKTGFFRQNKRVQFSTLQFDEIFMLQFEIQIRKKNTQKIRENVGVDQKSTYVIYEWPNTSNNSIPDYGYQATGPACYSNSNATDFMGIPSRSGPPHGQAYPSNKSGQAQMHAYNAGKHNRNRLDLKHTIPTYYQVSNKRVYPFIFFKQKSEHSYYTLCCIFQSLKDLVVCLLNKQKFNHQHMNGGTYLI